MVSYDYGTHDHISNSYTKYVTDVSRVAYSIKSHLERSARLRELEFVSETHERRNHRAHHVAFGDHADNFSCARTTYTVVDTSPSIGRQMK